MNELEIQIKEYLVERDWYGLEPADIAKSIMIEGAELLELFQWKNLTISEINANPALKQKIENELADVMIYAIEMAIHLNVGMESVIKNKLEHNKEKYPADKVRDKETGDDFYFKQKSAYRKSDK